MPRVAAFPGTFDPLTVAHLAVAEAAWRATGVERVELVLSRAPIGKPGATPLAERLAELEAICAGRPWLGVAVTDHRLVADVAEGYDVLVVGADKWAQVLDPSYHDDPDAWQRSLARLPEVVVATRGDHPVPGRPGIQVVEVDFGHVSSSAVRAGRTEWRAG